MHRTASTTRDWPQLKQFVRGGFWRNFKVKYPESNEMYSRMLKVSRRLRRSWPSDAGDASSPTCSRRPAPSCTAASATAATGTGRSAGSTCRTCATRLPPPDRRRHLLEQLAGRDRPWVDDRLDDYNLDARKEVRLASDRLVASSPRPAAGSCTNSTSAARAQPAGDAHPPAGAVSREGPPAGSSRQHGDGQAASIHDRVAFKQPDLDKQLQYDDWPRKSCVDHFLQPGLSLEEFRPGDGEIGDFVLGVYETRLRQAPRRVEAICGHSE